MNVLDGLSSGHEAHAHDTPLSSGPHTRPYPWEPQTALHSRPPILCQLQLHRSALPSRLTARTTWAVSRAVLDVTPARSAPFLSADHDIREPKATIRKAEPLPCFSPIAYLEFCRFQLHRNLGALSRIGESASPPGEVKGGSSPAGNSNLKLMPLWRSLCSDKYAPLLPLEYRMTVSMQARTVLVML